VLLVDQKAKPPWSVAGVEGHVNVFDPPELVECAQ